MSVLSIRLNKEEENILNKLSAYFEKDKSTLVKQSLREFYEDYLDRIEIEEFEEREAEGETNFVSFDEILEEL
ncbi:MAG TPA: hypothetical protein DCO79_09440 [Spirochaeta sp.]|nr:hypothetical protein [Spirochaeta sp.]